MAVAFGIEERDKVLAFMAKGCAGFVAEHQPVVPVADVVLQPLEGFADGKRVGVFGGRLSNVAGLLRTLAEVVQIVGVELLHFVHETGKGFERNDGGAARTVACARPLGHGGFEGLGFVVEF